MGCFITSVLKQCGAPYLDLWIDLFINHMEQNYLKLLIVQVY